MILLFISNWEYLSSDMTELSEFACHYEGN
jgi:hypothetical protein